MSEAIVLEMQFFLVSVFWGIIILIIYDCLRILRRIIPHNKQAVASEDLLFWIFSGVLIFNMMYEQNNGIIRGFSIMGMAIGMLLYNHSFSSFYVERTSILLRKVLGLIARLFGCIIKPVEWIVKRGYWLLQFSYKRLEKCIKYLLKRLKKTWKTVKITVNKK